MLKIPISFLKEPTSKIPEAEQASTSTTVSGYILNHFYNTMTKHFRFRTFPLKRCPMPDGQYSSFFCDPINSTGEKYTPKLML
ncbi:hypothetical protein NPIL_119561 [Nephila pilipes]|uniref:Uncharacterized protein n=1 Tax=Nephila pilipes TaxID=299642 RepID=A0A8X6NW58_NEPPI|nr:hypothetical protein NPIL_119561 [Nephila pilipes]